jgi:hypothetical protein
MATDKIKNKELTKRKLIDAVGQVFRTEGYAGLGNNKTTGIGGVNKVARIAGVNKKLIYRLRFSDMMKELQVLRGMEETKKLIGQVLKNQFEYFANEREMQELILWELSSNSAETCRR